jgi:hypothetical protein
MATGKKKIVPKCGPKHVAVIKENQSKEFIGIFLLLLTTRIPQRV